VNGIGARARRLEDPPLLTGKGRFAADVSFPDQLHMHVVRANVAHGRLAGLDTAEALAAPGVVAVWTGADVADLPRIDFRMSAMDALKPYRQPVLAQCHVRYVGEPVAAVFAHTLALAEDAGDLVLAEIEDAEPDLDATAPPGDFAPGLSNAATVIEKGYGDLDAAFAGSERTIEATFAVGRHSGTPLETRGAIARLDPATGILELHGAAKVPHQNRLALAELLGRDPGLLHLHEGHVGGGFGIRGELYPEDVLVCLAALRLERPVKWIEDRREHLIAANHSRGQVYALRAAVGADGVIAGLDAEFWHDQGAYVRTHAGTVPDLSAAMLPGPYLVPAYRVRGNIRLTNKTPAGTFRSPGRFESTFARERLMDRIAWQLGIDPFEVRRRNLIAADAMPFARGLTALGTELVYDSGDFAGLLARFGDHFAIDTVRREVARRRAAGQAAGFGFAMFVEKSGFGPFGIARVGLQANGRLEIVTGAASVGQGVETTLAQICCDVLPVPLEQVTVVHGQTDRIAEGRGAFASRITSTTGPAVHLAAVELRGRILDEAGRLLQAEPAELEFADARLRVRGRPAGPSVGLADVAAAAPSPLSVESKFLTDRMNYPFGVHGAVVLVDTETGGVAAERVMVAYDIGRAVNPAMVEGQIAGGVAQGVGGALLEEFVYDAAGQPLATTFADYLLPTLAEMPEIDMLICEDAPSPLNPLGVKGAGEAGLNGVGAAVASAIDDALQMPGAVTRLPVAPRDIRAILRARDGA
jgi:CO/xanthine dehydrogenase Mo-binding subunit